MSIEQFTKDMNIIAKLDSEPNDMGGLSAEQLKAKFDEGGLALQKYINEVILPRMGEPWQGDLHMNGYRITGLGEPAEGTDAIRKMDAAPSGYGLGGSAKRVELDADLNSVTANGFYSWETAVNAPFSWGYMEVRNSTASKLTQIAHSMSRGNVICMRSKTTAWGEWEYITPPMEVGAEYRTVERAKGSAVYAKRVDYTFTDAIGSVTTGLVDYTIPHGISGFDKLVRCVCTDGNYILPYVDSNSGGTISVKTVDIENINLRTYKASLPARTLSFCLYYTKS